jgi:23S rRNA (cytidine1920-2'-O)/16S rRNA (cytidine1409-2'-O)-methyltransferase
VRRPLDQELVRRGLIGTPDQARELILAGRVTVGGRPAFTPRGLVAPEEPLVVEQPRPEFVSRGGHKLRAALDRFDLVVEGRRCLDAGASTGGFTDVLLAAGASHVVTVDVGYGQLAWELRTDPRVTAMERTNVRDVDPADLPFAPQVVTADLSFTSLATVVPVLARLAAAGADLVLLVKPQFEAPSDRIGPGGVVSDPEVWRDAIRGAAEACREAGLGPLAVMASPIRGPAGNVEFLVHARKGAPGTALDIEAALSEVPGP